MFFYHRFKYQGVSAQEETALRYSTQKHGCAPALCHRVHGNCGQLKGWSGDKEGGEGEKHSLLWLSWEGMGTVWKATTKVYHLDDLGSSFCTRRGFWLSGTWQWGVQACGCAAPRERVKEPIRAGSGLANLHIES